MTADLFGQGLELMLVGMGTVFVFLSALVLATTAMSRLVLHFEGEPPAPGGGAGAEEAEEVAAISAAIALHRRRR